MRVMPEYEAVPTDGNTGGRHRHDQKSCDEVIHKPVLLREVLEALAPLQDGVFLDATFGAGGYSRAMLDAGAKAIYGNDRDPLAQALAAELQAEDERLRPLAGTFSSLGRHHDNGAFPLLDGLVADLGVSSMQLDMRARGFSFQKDGPLDMRMSQSGETAADIVNTSDEKALANLIYRYGEEKFSRRIASAIVRERDSSPIATTGRLAEIIKLAVPPAARFDRIHPATRTFQALRIVVNDELAEAEALLEVAPRLLKPGGRLVIVSFHSLEDRLVKKTLTSGRAQPVNRHMPVLPDQHIVDPDALMLMTKRAIMPDDAEIEDNPRSRSARMRIAIKPAPGDR